MGETTRPPKGLEKQIREALTMRAIWKAGGKHIPKQVALLLEQIEPHHEPTFYRYNEEIRETLLAWEEGVPAKMIAEEAYITTDAVWARVRTFARLLAQRLIREDIAVYCEDTHGKSKSWGRTKADAEPVTGCSCPACERLRR